MQLSSIKLRFIFLVFISLCCLQIKASDLGVEQSIKRSEELKLFANNKWLNLLHYKESWNGSFVSDITNENFFIYDQGRTDPKNELNATIKKIFSEDENLNDASFQCRFPARFTFLQVHLPLLNNAKKQKCKKYLEFIRNDSISSVSIVFANGYFSNPASFFGHPFLKFKSKDDASSGLLDTSVNYGAFSPKNENPIIYAVKGLFGGYKAGYTSSEYYYSENIYGEIELRDLWEYELNLTDAQIKELIAHIYELFGNEFPYYFFSDNCAYRFAELLDLITEKKITGGNPIYALPVNLIKNLKRSGLVKNITYHPSKQSRFHQKYLKLSSMEKEQFQIISEDNKLIHSDNFKSKSNLEKIKILESLISYSSYQGIVNYKELSAITKSRTLFLKERTQLPISESLEDLVVPTNSPESGQNVFQTQFGFLDKYENSFYLKIRPVYYDYLTSASGFLGNSELRVLDIEVYFQKSLLRFNDVSLIVVENLNTSKTGLKDDGGYAWGFKTGYRESHLDLKGHGAYFLGGGFGKAISLFKIQQENSFFCLADSLTEVNGQDIELYLGPRCGGLVKYQSLLSTLVTYQKYFNILNGKDFEQVNADIRIGLTTNWDLQVGFEDTDSSVWKIGTSLYW